MTPDSHFPAWLGFVLMLGATGLLLLAVQRRNGLLLAAVLACLAGSMIGQFLLGWLVLPLLFWLRRTYPVAIRAWSIPAALAIAAGLLALKLPWPLRPPPGPTTPAQAIVRQVEQQRSVYLYDTGHFSRHHHFEDLPVPIEVVLLDLSPAGHGPLFARDLVDSGSVAGLAPGATVPVVLSSSDRGAARLAGGTRSFGWRALLHFLLRTCAWGAFWTLALTPVARRLRRSLRPAPSGAAALLLIVTFGPAPIATGPAPQIPLCQGLRIVTAVSRPEGDYESIKTVTSLDGAALGISYSSESPENGAVRRLTVRRTVRLADLRDASFYLHHFHNQAPVTIPGSTALGTSAAVLHQLKTTGAADLSIIEGTYAATTADPAKHPNIFDYRMTERARREGTAPVMVPVIVNDVQVMLPAIEAKANYTGDKADFLFLDDESNPLALRYRIGKDALDVTKISYTCAGTPRAAQVTLSRIEKALLETGRADVYSIYFSFNSAELRPESDSTLAEIGEVLRRHPDWKLAVNGHTDNIGGDAYNLDLSKRRAGAVVDALAKRFAISPGRLSASGSGSKSPKDTNDTIEGRAHNRRVELVRTP